MKLTIRTLSAWLLLSTSLWSMDTKLPQIKPYSDKPITNVPDYLYANCNQYAVKKYDKGELSSLKQETAFVTKESAFDEYMKYFPDLQTDRNTIKMLVTGKFPIPQAKKYQEEYTRSNEHLDWIYAMNFLEQLAFAGDISSSLKDDEKIEKYLQAINHRVTRLTADKAGEFRTEAMAWGTVESLTQMEEMLYSFMEQFLAAGLMIDHEQNISAANLKDIFNAFYQQEMGIRHQFGNEYVLEVNSPKFKEYSKKLQYKTIFPEWKLDQFNVDEVDSWITDKNKGVINLRHWISSRNYPFPQPENFKKELKKIKICMLDASLNPIERAALVWYYLIRTHLFNEANKRTAKVVASGLLLKAGYLPPLITDNDGKRYVNILIDCFKKENPQEFVAFIYEMVEKTQQMAKDGLLDVNIKTNSSSAEAYYSFFKDFMTK